MRIFGLNIDFANKKPNFSVKTQDQEGGRPVEIRKVKKVNTPVLAYRSSFTSRGHFEPPEYNLAEIGRVEDVESYVRQSFRKKCGLMFKEGWEFIGPNLRTVKYIQNRFMQIEAASDIPTKLLMRETAMNLIKYSNAYWVKVRSQRQSGGRPRPLPGTNRKLAPIAAYFNIPPETVEIKRNKNGKVIKYRQCNQEGRIVEFEPIDVIHFYFDRKSGFATGTPFVVPVLDDIRALRRIEENIELLVYQHLFPLFHYKVGTPEMPAETYPDGTTEVDIVKQEIQFMPSEGGIVTPERHEIVALGAEGRAIRAEGYLTHFKKRVFSGLGLSAVDFGEGETANRATADNMSRSLVDDVKAMQREFETFINEFVIKELLLESTFTNPLDKLNRVHMVFHEVDLDAKIKVENHEMTLYQGFVTTEDEARRALGREPLTDEERKGTFWERIAKPKALIQSLDEKFIQEEAVATEGISSSEEQQTKANKERMAEEERLVKTKSKETRNRPTIKPSGAEKTAKSKNQPSNQHGTNHGPTKRKSSFTYSLSDNIIKQYYNMLKSDTIMAVKEGKYDDIWFKAVSLAAAEKAKEKFIRELRREFRKGVREAKVDIYLINTDFAFDILRDRANIYIIRIIDRLTRMLSEKIDNQLERREIIAKITAIFEALEFRTDLVYRSELHKAHMFGLALGLKAVGYEQAQLSLSEDACEECINNKDLTIDLKYVTIEQVPGLHPNCQCGITPIKVNPEDSTQQDLTAKEERCVLGVKKQLRKKYPNRSEKEIKVSAIKICRAAINESEVDEMIENLTEEEFDA